MLTREGKYKSIIGIGGAKKEQYGLWCLEETDREFVRESNAIGWSWNERLWWRQIHEQTRDMSPLFSRENGLVEGF